MGAETLKIITGIGQPLLGTVTTYDALTGRFREISFGRSGDVAPITELIDYDLLCGVDSAPQKKTRNPKEDDILNTPTQPTDGEVGPDELAQLLDSAHAIQLVDIREPFERSISVIEPSELIPVGTLMNHLDELRRDIPVVLYCRSGARSGRALAELREIGFDNVSHLTGGIDAYAVSIDPSLVRY